MKFKVKSAREQRWIEEFARKNGFIGGAGFWPSLVVIRLNDKSISWYGPTAEKYPSIVDFIKGLGNKEVMLYEDGILAGPFKMSIEPQIGDIVKIVDSGHLYSAYYDWFKDYPNIAARYAYMNTNNINGKVGIIVAYGPLNKIFNNMVYAIEFKEDFYKPIYLMDRDAFVFKDVGWEDNSNEVLG